MNFRTLWLALFVQLSTSLHIHHVETIRHSSSIMNLVQDNFIQRFEMGNYKNLTVERFSDSKTTIQYHGKTFGYPYQAVYNIMKVNENQYNITYQNNFVNNHILLEKINPDTVKIDLTFNTDIPMSKQLVKFIIRSELSSFGK